MPTLYSAVIGTSHSSRCSLHSAPKGFFRSGPAIPVPTFSLSIARSSENLTETIRGSTTGLKHAWRQLPSLLPTALQPPYSKLSFSTSAALLRSFLTSLLLLPFLTGFPDPLCMAARETVTKRCRGPGLSEGRDHADFWLVERFAELNG